MAFEPDQANPALPSAPLNTESPASPSSFPVVATDRRAVINRLPFEIVTGFLRATVLLGRGRTFHKDRHLLRSVCRLWTAVIDSDPHSWNHIFLDCRTPVSVLLSVLESAKSVDFFVFVDCQFPFDGRDQSNLAALLAVLAPYAGRCRTLELNLENDVLCRIVMAEIRKATFSRLTSFKVAMSSPYYRGRLPEPSEAPLPKLRHVSFEYTFPTWTTLVSFRHLSSLSLSFMHSLPKPFVCDIHALLSSALSLERLSLIYVDPHMIDLANMSQDRLLNPPSVALDNVYHIHFAMSHLRCHYFFDSLVTPNLRSFVLQVNNEHDLLPFVTASRERFLSVKTLVLVCHLSCSDLLAQVLQCFPRLVELDGSRSPAFTMAFHGVALYHPKVVPRLRKIRFSEFSLPISSLSLAPVMSAHSGSPDLNHPDLAGLDDLDRRIYLGLLNARPAIIQMVVQAILEGVPTPPPVHSALNGLIFPVEIMTNIFAFLASSVDPAVPSFTVLRLAVSLVCLNWRSLVVQTPRFWTCLLISPMSTPHTVATFLLTSRLRQFDFAVVDIPGRMSLCERDLARLLAVVLQASSRCRSVCVDLAIPRNVQAVLLHLIDRVPHVERLRIACSLFRALPRAGFPQLSLELSSSTVLDLSLHRVPYLAIFRGSFPALQRLTLSDLPWETSPSPAQFTDFLMRSSSLSYLDLRRMRLTHQYTPLVFTPINLPALRSLRLEFDEEQCPNSVSTLAPWLRRLMTPALEDLQLVFASEDDLSRYVRERLDFAAPSVAITGSFVSPKLICSFFELLTSTTRLDLVGCPGSTILLQLGERRVLDGSRTVAYLPRLTHLLVTPAYWTPLYEGLLSRSSRGELLTVLELVDTDRYAEQQHVPLEYMVALNSLRSIIFLVKWSTRFTAYEVDK
ncbi:hypothetical protein R3P38DRAFT_3189729 [Favolaschia claudopus]|uniref:F-box domain-containing protein n=2 Tax=Favolaschia claudopus TaxID=2862362 RepID=A0AAW0BPV1_9AGAR